MRLPFKETEQSKTMNKKQNNNNKNLQNHQQFNVTFERNTLLLAWVRINQPQRRRDISWKSVTERRKWACSQRGSERHRERERERVEVSGEVLQTSEWVTERLGDRWKWNVPLQFLSTFYEKRTKGQQVHGGKSESPMSLELVLRAVRACVFVCVFVCARARVCVESWTSLVTLHRSLAAKEYCDSSL